MRKIVAGTSVIGMALALAACGSKTTANDSVANLEVGNEAVFNDDVPADANLSAIGNGGEAALPANAGETALPANAGGATANAL